MKQVVNCTSWPASIIIIGAGRWARVIIKELNDIAPLSVSFVIHSKNHINSIRSWVLDHEFEREIKFSSGWPPLAVQKDSTHAIIVNAAKDHPEAVEWALQNCSAVLVEKPMAPSPEVMNNYLEWAEQSGSFLAPAQVFLFARHIDNFAQYISKQGKLTSLLFDWTDPKDEIRYGEKKAYDPNLPLYEDWLPHIIPIVDKLTGNLPEFSSLEVNRGGAALKIELKAAEIPCHIHIERDSTQRKRIIQASVEGVKYELDFSIEPGTISSNHETICADELWDTADRPLKCMLKALIHSYSQHWTDNRFDINPAIRCAEIVKKMRKDYLEKVACFKKSKRLDDKSHLEEIKYALSEKCNF